MSLNFLKIAFFLLALWCTHFVQSQGHHHTHSDPRGTTTVDWNLPNISRVISANWGFSFGIESYPRKGLPKKIIIDDKVCFQGSYFSFDVDDNFAYDIDEDVILTILLRDKETETFNIAYDKNVESMAQVNASRRSLGNGWYESKVILKRARFANRGHQGTDFTIFAKGANPFNLKMDETHTLTIAKINISRSKILKDRNDIEKVTINTVDMKGNKTPVRLGIYKAHNDWMPLPSNKALKINYFSDETRQLFLRSTGERQDYWPSKNRHFIYSGGHYEAKLPTGKYKLVISKGPEYRIEERVVEISTNKDNIFNIGLTRWINMPENSWYSGDAHIHVNRSKKENSSLLKMMQAEDIHLSNLLQMGNPGAMHFHQYMFGKNGRYNLGNYSLIPGVEDPRTVHHGHTVALNITENLHNRDEYFLYHKVLKAYQNQGGFTGYAHVDRNWFNDEGGLALNVPMGVIDFLEIMQFGEMQTNLWYTYLNLGFKLLPIAGSDFPYLDHPGSVRSYVQIDGPFTPDKWFESFKEGKTFVTNGPMLSFTVNEQPMGSVINIDEKSTLHIKAEVKNNIQIDSLKYMELIMNGKVIKKVSSQNGKTIKLNHKIMIDKGSWLSVRVYGIQRAMAHSNATYIHFKGQGHLQKDLIESIVPEQIRFLERLQDDNLNEILEIEYHEATPDIYKIWLKHKKELNIKIENAKKYYYNLLKRY